MQLISPLWRGAPTLFCLLGAALGAPAYADEYVGLVHPAHELTLSMGLGGIVAQLNVRHGQSVKAKQVLLVLDDRMQAIEAGRRQVVVEDIGELEASTDRVNALKIMVQDTRAVFEKTGSISRDEMSKLDVEYSAARGRLAQLEAQKRREKLEYEGAVQERDMRRLTAPVAGIIAKIEPKVGEWAKPGEPLMMLVDASTCFLITNIPLRSVTALHAGMNLPVRFESAAGTNSVTGTISFVSTIADPASGLVEIRVSFANPGLKIRPGIKGMIDVGPGAKSL